MEQYKVFEKQMAQPNKIRAPLDLIKTSQIPLVTINPLKRVNIADKTKKNLKPKEILLSRRK